MCVYVCIYMYVYKHLHISTLFQCLHKVRSMYWLLDHTASQHMIYCSLSPFYIVISSRHQEAWFPSLSCGIYLFDQSSLHNLRPQLARSPQAPKKASPSLQWEGDCEWTVAPSDQNAPWGVNSAAPAAVWTENHGEAPRGLLFLLLSSRANVFFLSWQWPL